MAQNVYRSALDAGVRRVVAASSNHAADWYEHALVHARRRELVSPAELPLSDNFYGWSKAAYELLGFVYASGGLGRKLEVVLLRIGPPLPWPARRAARGPGCVRPGQLQAGPGRVALEPRPAAARQTRDRDARRAERPRGAMVRDVRDQREHARVLVARERAPCARLRA